LGAVIGRYFGRYPLGARATKGYRASDGGQIAGWQFGDLFFVFSSAS
jgi:hypothetical protein